MPASTRLALLGLADGKGTGLHVARDTCSVLHPVEGSWLPVIEVLSVLAPNMSCSMHEVVASSNLVGL